MTEKQFVYMDLLETEAISVSDDECYYFNEYGTVQKICELLNELNEENKELKAKVDDKEVAVEVECEKLMQKVLDLIDEKIEYYSNKYELYDTNAIDVLEELKKELEND